MAHKKEPDWNIYIAGDTDGILLADLGAFFKLKDYSPSWFLIHAIPSTNNPQKHDRRDGRTAAPHYQIDFSYLPFAATLRSLGFWRCARPNGNRSTFKRSSVLYPYFPPKKKNNKTRWGSLWRGAGKDVVVDGWVGSRFEQSSTVRGLSGGAKLFDCFLVAPVYVRRPEVRERRDAAAIDVQFNCLICTRRCVPIYRSRPTRTLKLTILVRP